MTLWRKCSGRSVLTNGKRPGRFPYGNKRLPSREEEGDSADILDYSYWVNFNCREQIEIAVTLFGSPYKTDRNPTITNSLKSTSVSQKVRILRRPKTVTAISICSRQFQFRFTHGNFNFTYGNFNLLTAISIYSVGNFNFSSNKPQVRCRLFLIRQHFKRADKHILRWRERFVKEIKRWERCFVSLLCPTFREKCFIWRSQQGNREHDVSWPVHFGV